jgi:hypothetical protein
VPGLRTHPSCRCATPAISTAACGY